MIRLLPLIVSECDNHATPARRRLSREQRTGLVDRDDSRRRKEEAQRTARQACVLCVRGWRMAVAAAAIGRRRCWKATEQGGRQAAGGGQRPGLTGSLCVWSECVSKQVSKVCAASWLRGWLVGCSWSARLRLAGWLATYNYDQNQSINGLREQPPQYRTAQVA